MIWMIFFKTFLFLKLVVYTSTLFKKETSILSHIAKKLQAHQYLQTAYNRQGCVNKHGFGANFRRKIPTFLSINYFFFLNFETGSFSDKLFCEN